PVSAAHLRPETREFVSHGQRFAEAEAEDVSWPSLSPRLGLETGRFRWKRYGRYATNRRVLGVSCRPPDVSNWAKRARELPPTRSSRGWPEGQTTDDIGRQIGGCGTSRRSPPEIGLMVGLLLKPRAILPVEQRLPRPISECGNIHSPTNFVANQRAPDDTAWRLAGDMIHIRQRNDHFAMSKTSRLLDSWKEYPEPALFQLMILNQAYIQVRLPFYV
ncbi:unnamed protein product, partial [Protopolystoma xenopodis]